MDKSPHSSKHIPRGPSLATPRLSSLLLWPGLLTPGSISLPTGRLAGAMPVLSSSSYFSPARRFRRTNRPILRNTFPANRSLPPPTGRHVS